MSFDIKVCIVLTCDGDCNDPWADYDYSPHFESIEDATAYAQDAGWLITSLKVLCGACAARAECAIAGHLWDEWRTTDYRGTTYRYRYCDRCSDTEYDPPVEQIHLLAATADIIDTAYLQQDGGPQ